MAVELSVGQALGNVAEILQTLLSEDDAVSFSREDLEETARIVGLIKMHATASMNHYFLRN